MKKLTIIIAIVIGLGFAAQPTYAAVKNAANGISINYSTSLTRQGINSSTGVFGNITDGYVYKFIDSASGATCFALVQDKATQQFGSISCIK